MTKSEHVLDRDYMNEKFVSFTGEYGDGSVIPTYIEIDRQRYLDFGEPEQITVTVTPGDTLNDDHRKDGYL